MAQAAQQLNWCRQGEDSRQRYPHVLKGQRVPGLFVEEAAHTRAAARGREGVGPASSLETAWPKETPLTRDCADSGKGAGWALKCPPLPESAVILPCT